MTDGQRAERTVREADQLAVVGALRFVAQIAEDCGERRVSEPPWESWRPWCVWV